MPWYKPAHKGDKVEYHVGGMSPVRSELRDALRQSSHPPSTPGMRRQSSGGPRPAADSTHSLSLGMEGHAYRDMASSLLERVYELRAGGADLVLDLPTVVVCGQQSAGKSSVVEALCGVPLPRKADTCTRCPTEVRLFSRPHPDYPRTWSAAIKLRTHGPHPHLPTPVAAARPGGASSSSSAAPGVQESLFAVGLPTPSAVEAAVAAAQAALLGGAPQPSPHQHHAQQGVSPSAMYPSLPRGPSPAPGAAGPPLKFSRDVVVVEVWGAPVDLCLVDTPGLIANVEDPGEGHYRALVEGLVRGYASRPGAIICAVVTCKEDIDTQPILSLVRECDPGGRRTLGVLTKPDQIEEGCHEQWMAVLSGARYPLGLGYYVLRCPSAADLAAAAAAAAAAAPAGKLSSAGSISSTSSSPRPDPSFSSTGGPTPAPGAAAAAGGGGVDLHAAARSREASFFSACRPWCGAAPGMQRRLGAGALREALCRALVSSLESSRPALLAAANKQLGEARAALAALPIPGGRRLAGGGGAGAAVVELIEAVTQPLREEVAGCGPDKSFYRHLLLVYQTFQRSLAATRPVFVVGPAAAAAAVIAAAASAQAPSSSASLSGSEPSTPGGGGGGGGPRAGPSSHCLSPAASGGEAPPLVVVTCTVEADLEVAIAAAGEAALGGCPGGVTPGGLAAGLAGRGGGLGALLGPLASPPPPAPGPSSGPSSGRGASGSGGPGGEGAGGEGGLVCPAVPLLSGALMAHQVLLPPSAAAAPGALSLGDVASLVGSLLSRELPGFSPYEALTVLVARHQEGWTAAAAACLEAARGLLGEAVEEAVGRSCQHLPAAAEAIRRVTEELLGELTGSARCSLEALLAQELTSPFTVHRLEFALLKQQHLGALEAHHAAACGAAACGALSLLQEGGGSGSGKGGGGGFLGRGNNNKGGSSGSGGNGRDGGRQAGGPPGAAAEGGVLPTHIAALTEAMAGPLSLYPSPGGASSSSSRGPAAAGTSSSSMGGQLGLSASGTCTSELLGLMAACLAYWGLSYRRLADVVPLMVSHHLVTGLTRELRGRLAAALLGGGGGEGALVALLAEDPAAAAQRAALEGRVALLDKAVALLRRP